MRRIIDRFEENYALLENPETGDVEQFPRSMMPEGAKEGDVLIEEGAAFHIARAETETRTANIRSRFEKLKKK